jgi:uncharacterized membrane protein YeiH
MVSGLGGGIIHDILLGALPPATFMDWRYRAGDVHAQPADPSVFRRKLYAIPALLAIGWSIFSPPRPPGWRAIRREQFSSRRAAAPR